MPRGVVPQTASKVDSVGLGVHSLHTCFASVLEVKVQGVPRLASLPQLGGCSLASLLVDCGAGEDWGCHRPSFPRGWKLRSLLVIQTARPSSDPWAAS